MRPRVPHVDRHRDYISKFEDRVFFGFRRHIPSNLSPHVASAAASWTSKDGVLKTLAALENAEDAAGRDEDAEAFVKDYRWLKKAWDDAVAAKGLRLDDYKALRSFKDKSNSAFHKPESPQDALLLLQSTAPLPTEVRTYKAPLIALLKFLSAK
jgi:hypothetical protein